MAVCLVEKKDKRIWLKLKTHILAVQEVVMENFHLLFSTTALQIISNQHYPKIFKVNMRLERWGLIALTFFEMQLSQISAKSHLF